MAGALCHVESLLKVILRHAPASGAKKLYLTGCFRVENSTLMSTNNKPVGHEVWCSAFPSRGRYFTGAGLRIGFVKRLYTAWASAISFFRFGFSSSYSISFFILSLTVEG